MATDFKACSIDGCNGNALNKGGGRRGLCSRHYWHWKQDRVGPSCSVEGCKTSIYALGLCNKHWQRHAQHGDPLAGRTPNGLPMRFLIETALKYDGDDCLIWPYARDNAGYARVYDGRRMKAAHIIVCEKISGPRPSRRYHAAHFCGKGHLGCINPGHLRWATVEENQADRIGHGTSNRGERQGNSRLTEDAIRQIRRLAESASQSEIAAMFSIDQSHVSDIVNRKRWGWLI